MQLLTNNKKISWVLILYIILYYNLDGTISYVLAILYVVYAIFVQNHGRTIWLHQLWPIVVIVFIGLFSGIGTLGTMDYLRDLYYFTQPIVFLYLGYLLDHNNGEKIDYCASLVMVAFLLSIIYMLKVIQNPAVLTQSDNIRDIRGEVGKETFIALVGVILMTTQNIQISKIKMSLAKQA